MKLPHDSKRKLKRNRALRRYHLKHPDVSWADVGLKFKVTRQRAWEINRNEERREQMKAEKRAKRRVYRVPLGSISGASVFGKENESSLIPTIDDRLFNRNSIALVRGENELPR